MFFRFILRLSLSFFLSEAESGIRGQLLPPFSHLTIPPLPPLPPPPPPNLVVIYPSIRLSFRGHPSKQGSGQIGEILKCPLTPDKLPTGS